MIHAWQDFPTDVKKHPFHVYKKDGIVSVDGFRRFRLKDLNNIPLAVRLSFPHDLFTAIHAAGDKGINRIKMR